VLLAVLEIDSAYCQTHESPLGLGWPSVSNSFAVISPREGP
jgi:hypothetical protein